MGSVIDFERVSLLIIESTYEEHRSSDSQEGEIVCREVDPISPEATGKKRG